MIYYNKQQRKHSLYAREISCCWRQGMDGVREEKKATKGEEKAANGQRPGRKGCRKGCEKRWWHIL
jgi:hypothetical protein